MRLLTETDLELSALDQSPEGPWFRAGMVSSLDGVIAVDGDSRALSGPGDRTIYRTLRAQSDAIVVGTMTARHPGYARIDRPLAIITNTGVVECAHERPMIVTTRTALSYAREAHPQASIITAGDQFVDLHLARELLLERGFRRLLCEGGPTLLHSLLRAGLIDEICITVAPMLVGAGPRLLPSELSARLALTHGAEDSGSLFLRYRVERPDGESGKMGA